MKRIFSVMFFCSLSMAWIYGQTSTPEEEILEEMTHENQALKEMQQSRHSNLARVTQIGNANSVMIMQNNDFSAQPAAVLVRQRGSDNSSTVDIHARESGVEVMQDGTKNTYLGWIRADHLESTILQKGNQNQVRQYLQGTDMKFHISQEGYGHEIIQTENGNNLGYSIKQSGKDMKIQIEQRHVMIKPE